MLSDGTTAIHVECVGQQASTNIHSPVIQLDPTEVYSTRKRSGPGPA